MKTTAFQVRLPTEDLTWLREHAKANDLTVAQVLRKMIRDKKKRSV